ncbi:discoidin domain-containing protein [Pectobacterium carotovorum]|uniref:discoidin domain-containing protein n=1 Tax=Pectobacterium carotovorum TaxID=554 RepID=UPI0029D604D8|nr:discoidin domain-containing protein [Pectobacterium carotovorum]MDX6913822.1 discoidin domain-containing protein [Pectobacterium carotovorum]
MKDINIEINVCDSTGKSTYTVHPHTCCHSDHSGGQEPGVSGVTSVFGRTGIVTAQAGDYTADQITETATRKFASPDEKTAWNAKQDALLSGSTIRTVFGQSLLGSGDVSPTPAQMGVAAVGHTHTTADITDYTPKTKQLIHSSLEAGVGVTLNYNPANEKTIISAVGGSGAGDSGYIVADRQGATAGQNHVFSISPQNTFNLAAYALKEEVGTANQTYVVDDFNTSSEQSYNATNAVMFGDLLHLYTGVSVQLEKDGEFYSSPVRADGRFISIELPDVKSNIIPTMSANDYEGFSAASSSQLNENSPAYKAMNGTTINNLDAWWSSKKPTSEFPQWIQVKCPNPTKTDGLRITNMNTPYANDLASPKSFLLQGSNDGVIWDEIYSVVNDSRNGNQQLREWSFPKSEAYIYFRLNITDSNGSGNFVQIGDLKLLSANDSVLIKTGTGEYFTASNGMLFPAELKPFNGFSDSGKIMASQLVGKLPISIVSTSQLNVPVKYAPYSQIAIQKSLTSAVWSQINSATLAATQTGNGKVRVAVTRDLVNWHVLRNGAWVDVGALSADTAGATALIADGMTPTELGSITAAQWTQLFSSNNGVPDSLAFAFALDITDPATDAATIDRLVLNVNDESNWKVQSPAEVEIRWRTDSVTFRTATAGNYKLAYQVP